MLNLCNSQYNQFYCLSYLQISVYSSKKFVTLIYLCLYLVLLIEQSLHYVSSTIKLKIMYNTSENLNLIDYLNSNYVSNKLDRKSIFEYCYIFDKELM